MFRMLRCWAAASRARFRAPARDSLQWRCALRRHQSASVKDGIPTCVALSFRAFALFTRPQSPLRTLGLQQVFNKTVHDSSCNPSAITTFRLRTPTILPMIGDFWPTTRRRILAKRDWRRNYISLTEEFVRLHLVQTFANVNEYF